MSFVLKRLWLESSFNPGDCASIQSVVTQSLGIAAMHPQFPLPLGDVFL